MSRCVRTWMLLIALAFLFGLVIFVVVSASHGGTGADVSSEPIYIFGDAAFAYASGVIGGRGTAEDPYLIEGWAISTPEADYGICIDHTTSYFVIRACTIEQTRAVGIYLNSVANGRIEDCTVRRNDAGIYLMHACDNILVSNRIVENHYGLVTTAYSCRNAGYNNVWEGNGLDVFDRGYDNRFDLGEEEIALLSPSTEAEGPIVSEAVVQSEPVVVEHEEELPAVSEEPSEDVVEDVTTQEVVPPLSVETIPADIGVQTVPHVFPPVREWETMQTPSEVIQTPSALLDLFRIQTVSEFFAQPATVQTASERASE